MLITPTRSNVKKPYLLQKHDRNLNLWYVRKCKTVHSYENAKLKKLTTYHSFDFRKEINNSICRCRIANAWKNAGNRFFSIDMFTRLQDEFPKCWLNMCAHATSHTWRSVSVMGQKQGFELAAILWLFHEVSVIMQLQL